MTIIDDYYSMSVARSWGYLYDGELFAMLAMARSLPEGSRIINIGAGSGTSSLAITEGIRGKKSILITIDISEGGPFGGLENERNVYDSANYHPYPRQILGDSKEIGRSWSEEPLDMIFVDGDHTKPGIDGDIEAWWPNLKPGGLMIFHDYGRDFWPQVVLSVDTHVKEYGAQILFVVDTLCVVRKM
jgi:predicted O-methyltransferase YrrM